MITNKQLNIEQLLVIDDTGMPQAPTIRQLMDVDVRALYTRDKSENKEKYIQECIVIYYLGDPKSPARQSGLSDKEALKMAIEQAGLKPNYIPDALVLKIIKKYYAQNITEAGLVVENLQQGIHNVGLSVKKLNSLLNEKIQGSIAVEDSLSIISIIDQLNKKASELPGLVKKLDEAKQNLLYETETNTARGGTVITSSMNIDEYM